MIPAQIFSRIHVPHLAGTAYFGSPADLEMEPSSSLPTEQIGQRLLLCFLPVVRHSLGMGTDGSLEVQEEIHWQRLWTDRRGLPRTQETPS